MSHPMRRNGEPTLRETALEVLRAAGKPVNIYAVWDGLEKRLRRVLSRKDVYACLAKLKADGRVVTTGRADKCCYEAAKK